MTMPAGINTPAYTLRYSSRAKRVRLSVLPGKVVVTAPKNTSLKLIDLFVRSRTGWIREKLDLFNSVEAPSSEIIPENGAPLWLFGRKYNLCSVSAGEGPVIHKDCVLADEEHLSVDLLRKWLDSQLMYTLAPMVGKYSTTLGVSPKRIRLGNASSRWGSCSSKGVIMMNRRLVHAPVSVIDYIAAHEVVHLNHRNHSPLFHEELNRLGTDVSSSRKWLRLQGAYLLTCK